MLKSNKSFIRLMSVIFAITAVFCFSMPCFAVLSDREREIISEIIKERKNPARGQVTFGLFTIPETRMSKLLRELKEEAKRYEDAKEREEADRLEKEERDRLKREGREGELYSCRSQYSRNTNKYANGQFRMECEARARMHRQARDEQRKAEYRSLLS